LLQVVLEVLLSAAAAGRRFHVVVLDSRPELEGRQMLRRLLQVGDHCQWAAFHRTAPITLKACWPDLLSRAPLPCIKHAGCVQCAQRAAQALCVRVCVQADIPSSYVLLSGLSYIMREVSKVGAVTLGWVVVWQINHNPCHKALQHGCARTTCLLWSC
jgi:hypothetical protein